MREAVAAEIPALTSSSTMTSSSAFPPINLYKVCCPPNGLSSTLHFVGRDAVDEINSYCPDHVLQLTRRYKVGTVTLPWSPLVPPVISGWRQYPDSVGSESSRRSLHPSRNTFEPRPLKALHQGVRDAGETPYLIGYSPDVIRYTLLASLSAYAYGYAWFLTSAVFLGLLWQRLAFVAHDLGHVGVTHDWTVDRILGTVIVNWIGGVSI
ncbi:hypothetical protein B0H19DRAFT_1248781 [Mycena capillaripes]|nr:hypothetical protein B0H19DRAFT_1248781 [Mycena capillaripes]